MSHTAIHSPIREAELFFGGEAQHLRSNKRLYQAYTQGDKNDLSLYIGQDVAGLLANPTVQGQIASKLHSTPNLVQIKVTPQRELFVAKTGTTDFQHIDFEKDHTPPEVIAIAEKSRQLYLAMQSSLAHSRPEDMHPRPREWSHGYPTPVSSPETAQLHERIHSLENQLANERLRGDMREIREDIRENRSLLLELLRSRDARSPATEREIETLRRQLKRTTGQVDRLIDQARDRGLAHPAEMDDLLRENDHLKRVCTGSQEDLKGLEEENDHLRRAYGQPRHELGTLHEELFSDTTEGALENLRSLERTIDTLREREGTLQEALKVDLPEDMLAKAVEIRGANVELRRQLDNAQKALKEYQERNPQATDEIKRLKCTVFNLNFQFRNDQETIHRLIQEVKELKARGTGNEERIEQLTGQLRLALQAEKEITTDLRQKLVLEKEETARLGAALEKEQATSRDLRQQKGEVESDLKQATCEVKQLGDLTEQLRVTGEDGNRLVRENLRQATHTAKQLGKQLQDVTERLTLSEEAGLALRKEVATLVQRIETLQRENATLLEQRNGAREALASLKHTHEKTEKRLLQVEAELLGEKDRALDAEERSERLRREFSAQKRDLEGQVRDRTTEVRERKEAHDAVSRRLEDAQRNLEGNQRDLHRLGEELVSLKSAAEREIERVGEIVLKQKSQLKELGIELERSREGFTALQSEHSQALKELRAEQEKGVTLQAKLDQASTTNLEQSRTIDALQKERAQLLDDNRELTEECDALRREKVRLEDLLGESEEHKQKLLHGISNLTRANEEQEMALVAQKQEIEDLSNELAHVRREAENQNAAYAKEVAELSQRLTPLEAQQLREELTSQKSAVLRLTEELRLEREKATAALEEVDKHVPLAEVRKRDETITRLEEELRKADLRSSALNEQLSLKKAQSLENKSQHDIEISQLRETLREVREEARQIRGELETANHLKQRAQRKVEHLTSELEASNSSSLEETLELKRQLSELRKAAKKATLTETRLNDQVLSLTRKAETLQVQLSEQEQNLSAQLHELGEQLRLTTEELAAANHSKERALQKVERLTSELEVSSSSSLEEILALKRELSEQKKAARQAQLTEARLGEQVSSLTRKTQDLQAQLSQRGEELALANAERLESQSQHESEVGLLRQSLKELQASLQAAERQVEERLTPEAERALRAENGRLKLALEHIAAVLEVPFTIEDPEELTASLLGRVKEIQLSKSQLQKAFDTHTEYLKFAEGATEERDTALAQRKEFESQAQTLELEVCSLKKDLKEAQAQATHFEEELISANSLNEKISDSAAREREGIVAQIKELEHTLQDREIRYEELNIAYRAAREETARPHERIELTQLQRNIQQAVNAGEVMEVLGAALGGDAFSLQLAEGDKPLQEVTNNHQDYLTISSNLEKTRALAEQPVKEKRITLRPAYDLVGNKYQGRYAKYVSSQIAQINKRSGLLKNLSLFSDFFEVTGRVSGIMDTKEFTRLTEVRRLLATLNPKVNGESITKLNKETADLTRVLLINLMRSIYEATKDGSGLSRYRNFGIHLIMWEDIFNNLDESLYVIKNKKKTLKAKEAESLRRTVRQLNVQFHRLMASTHHQTSSGVWALNK
ncbi:hypothetical protein [Candidatus Neptunichlamydia sp. REUL1]|uniref:hypothetical protein n=1 Tax=Candidatus Neptunichlamydia sp. REUL1 TaxID=3064277 RepID=UPI00292E09E3|nr:hypothetical protein [Candidatus Neptunochlamydia sp. REUL1]